MKQENSMKLLKHKIAFILSYINTFFALIFPPLLMLNGGTQTNNIERWLVGPSDPVMN